MSQTRRMHQALAGYLSPAQGPTDVTAPSTNARHPVAPGGAIPPGSRPIPASTEGPKKTNVPIPVARECVCTYGIAGLQHTLGEGDIVMAERVAFSQKRGSDMASRPHFVRVRSIESVNNQLADPKNWRVAGSAPITYEKFGFAVDGVVNNTDGADALGEFKDRPICNSVVQGPVRFAHAQGPVRYPEKLRCRIRDVVYVGLFDQEAVDDKGTAVAGQRMYQLRVFSSREVRTLSRPPNVLADLRFLWRVGSIIDTNPSPNYMSINVNIERLHGLEMADFVTASTPIYDPTQSYTHKDDGIYYTDNTQTDIVEMSFRKHVGGENRKLPVHLRTLDALLNDLHVV